MSNSLRLHGLQYTRPPCSSPTPIIYPNSCPLSRECHPTTSTSVVPFSRLQSFPASGSFPMSQVLESGGQSIGVSPSAPVLPMNIKDWFPLGWTGWISLLSKGLSRVFSNNTAQKHQFFGFGIVNKTEVDVFLKLSCFFNDPTDCGNLISGSSAFSKSSLNIWKFTVHVLLNLLWPWGFPGKNTGVGCHFLLRGIFLSQGLNLGLLHCRQMLYHLSHQEGLYCWILAWRIWAFFFAIMWDESNGFSRVKTSQNFW